MKVAICGKNIEYSLNKYENILKTRAIRFDLNAQHAIINLAKETFGHNDERNVLYGGCALQFLNDRMDDDLFEVYEQIALSSIANLDRIVVVTENMSESDIEMYKGYEKMFPNKIKLIVDESDIIV